MKKKIFGVMTIDELVVVACSAMTGWGIADRLLPFGRYGKSLATWLGTLILQFVLVLELEQKAYYWYCLAKLGLGDFMKKYAKG